MLDAMPAPAFDAWLAAYIVDPWAELRVELAMSDEDIVSVFQQLAEEERKR